MPFATPPATPRKARTPRHPLHESSDTPALAWAPPRPRRTASSPERATTPTRRSTRSIVKCDSSPATPGAIASFSTAETRDEPPTPPATPRKPGFSAIIAKLSHATGKVKPGYTPKRGDNKSCDPCNKRREKCDHYTVCGSCIVHGTVCTWHRATPLYERETFASSERDNTLAELENEAHALREKIAELAPRAGLEAEHLLKPKVLSSVLENGLPPSPPTSPTHCDADETPEVAVTKEPATPAPKKRNLTIKLASMRFTSETRLPLPPPPPSPPVLDYVPKVHAATLPSFPDKPLPALAGLEAENHDQAPPLASKSALQPLYAMFDQAVPMAPREGACTPPRAVSSLSPTPYLAFIRSPNPSPPPSAPLPALLPSVLPALPSPTFAHSSPPKFRPRGLQATLSPQVELKPWWSEWSGSSDNAFDAGPSWIKMDAGPDFVVKDEPVEDDGFFLYGGS